MREEDVVKNPCKSIQKCIGYFLMVSSLIMLLVVCYMAWFPMQVVELKSIELVGNKLQPIVEVKQGQMMTYKLTLRKYINLPCEIRVQVVNKYITSYPVYSSNIEITSKEKIKKGEWDIVYARIPFPRMPLAGEHYITLTLIYRINMFRVESYTVRSKLFNVLEGDGYFNHNVPLVIEKEK